MPVTLPIRVRRLTQAEFGEVAFEVMPARAPTRAGRRFQDHGIQRAARAIRRTCPAAIVSYQPAGNRMGKCEYEGGHVHHVGETRPKISPMIFLLIFLPPIFLPG